jgi:hypothetical protein
VSYLYFFRRTAGICFFAVFFFSIVASAQSQPRVAWQTNGVPSATQVVISDLSPEVLDRLRKTSLDLVQWQKILSVYADTGENPLALLELPAMSGTYSVEDGKVIFKPQFPLQAGVEYRAMFRPGALSSSSKQTDVLTARLKLPARDLAPSAVVENIFPSAPELPENLLKFYVQFSAPMSGGAVYEHIQLLNEKGDPVELPFLEIDEELWNPEMTRLTLFIDPGRIKRGVKPLEDIGPALEAGHEFVLKIAPHWKDATGAPLKAGFEKRFKVTAPDRASPDHKKWQVRTPQAEGMDPLKVWFGEPLDYALALRLLYVTGQDGTIVSGRSKLEDHERTWSFIPERAWSRGNYQLRFENILEDLAGNSIGKPFEVDLFEGVERKLTRTTLSLPLEIK